MAAPSSTTNMTKLWYNVLGSSLRTESKTARLYNKYWSIGDSDMDHTPGRHDQLFCDRSKGKGGKETEYADNQDDKYKPYDEEWPVVTDRPFADRNNLL